MYFQSSPMTPAMRRARTPAPLTPDAAARLVQDQEALARARRIAARKAMTPDALAREWYAAPPAARAIFGNRIDEFLRAHGHGGDHVRPA